MLFRLFCISSVSAFVLTACATQQENPYYKYSSKYEGNGVTTNVASLPTQQIQSAPVNYQTAPVTYGASQGQATYTRVDHKCLSKQTNRELLGAGLGGTIGAIAGKKLIGGTKGTVIGAGLGGAAGYGIGDKSIDCDPVTVVADQPNPIVSQAYSPSSNEQYVVSQPTPAVSNVYSAPTDTQFADISNQGTPGYQVLQAQSVEYDYSENIVDAEAATIPSYSETRIMSGTFTDMHSVRQGDTVYSLSRKLCVGIDDISSLNGLGSNYAINIGDTLRLPASRC